MNVSSATQTHQAAPARREIDATSRLLGCGGEAPARSLAVTHLGLKQVVFHRSPFQRPHGHKSSSLADAERVALVPVHDGKGEGGAVVGGVPVGHSQLEDTCAFGSVLLRGTREDC